MNSHHIKTTYPDAKLVGGNTELGIEVKFKNAKYPVLIHPELIHELTHVEQKGKNTSCYDMQTMNMKKSYKLQKRALSLAAVYPSTTLLQGYVATFLPLRTLHPRATSPRS